METKLLGEGYVDLPLTISGLTSNYNNTFVPSIPRGLHRTHDNSTEKFQRKVAVKRIRADHLVDKEVDVLLQADHQNIVRYFYTVKIY